MRFWIRTHRNKGKMADLWKIFTPKLAGHARYYGISLNGRSISAFQMKSLRIFYKWLNRRSQRKSIRWDKFTLFLQKNTPPRVRIIHWLQFFCRKRMILSSAYCLNKARWVGTGERQACSCFSTTFLSIPDIQWEILHYPEFLAEIQ